MPAFPRSLVLGATIAASVGVVGTDAFRRAFERRLGAKPRGYVNTLESHSAAILAK